MMMILVVPDEISSFASFFNFLPVLIFDLKAFKPDWHFQLFRPPSLNVSFFLIAWTNLFCFFFLSSLSQQRRWSLASSWEKDDSEVFEVFIIVDTPLLNNVASDTQYIILFFGCEIFPSLDRTRMTAGGRNDRGFPDQSTNTSTYSTTTSTYSTTSLHLLGKVAKKAGLLPNIINSGKLPSQTEQQQLIICDQCMAPGWKIRIYLKISGIICQSASWKIMLRCASSSVWPKSSVAGTGSGSEESSLFSGTLSFGSWQNPGSPSGSLVFISCKKSTNSRKTDTDCLTYLFCCHFLLHHVHLTNEPGKSPEPSSV